MTFPMGAIAATTASVDNWISPIWDAISPVALVAGRPRKLKGMMLEEQAHLCDLPQIRHRDRRNLEALLAFSQDQTFRGELVEDLPQGGDARPVFCRQALALQPLGGFEPRKQDIGANLAIGDLANG